MIQKYKNNFIAIFAFFFLLLTINACTMKKSEATITVAISGNPDTLDPHRTSATLTKQINHSIYDTLVESDLSPRLAEKWSISHDRLSWTFTLRDDVFFHHGEKFTAQDVIATIERIQNPETDSPMRKQFSLIKRAYAKDAEKVTIVLTKPSVELLALFAEPGAAILPKDLIEKKHNFNRTPTGTGPFRFSQWVDNTSITLHRNENYRQNLAIESLVFLVFADPTVMMQAIIQKEIDVAPLYVTNTEMSQIRNVKHMKIVKENGTTILVLAMNLRKSVFSDKNFRRAVAQSIDKEVVLKDAYNGGRQVVTFWPLGTPYSVSEEEFRKISDTEPVMYNPLEAKKYFSAYFKNKVKETLVITVPQNYAPHVRAAQLYQDMFKTVGLDTKIELVDWSTWLSRVYRKGIFDFTVIGHTGKITPEQRLRGYGAGKSYIGWNDEEFLSILESARTTVNHKERINLYKKAFVRMGEAQPFVFVGQNLAHFAHNICIKNIRKDPLLELYDFRYVRIE